MTVPATGPPGIQTLFPDCVSTSCCRIEEVDVTLDPEERAAIEHAVAGRRQEYLAGRLCARQALEQCGIKAGHLRTLPDGAIAWPEGFIGALSHSEIWCGAAIARRSETAGIGLDIETIARIKEKIWRRILTPEERSWIAGQPPAEMQQWAALIFSAKEALYKCIAAHVQQRMGFMDAVIVPDLPQRSFTVRLNEPVTAQLPRGQNLQGRFFFYAGSVFSGLVLV
jgi:phosphopantetheine--protein transferase-like protein